MKVEHLLAQYLYNNKTVSLQDIGIFTVSSNLSLPMDNEKESVLPAGSISFEYDQHARQDEGLVDFIVQQTRKIRPLASSDLESYSILGRQFLNIGKPFHIEGVGTLLKNQEGDYEFTQGQTVNARLDTPVQALKEKEHTEVDFSLPEKEASSKKGWLVAVIALIVLAVGAGIFYYLRNESKEKPVDVSAKTDTVPNVSTPVAALDSTRIADSMALATKPAEDGSTFKVVIKEYPTKAAAEKALAKLSSYGHKLVLSPIDSVRYKLAMPFTTPLSDTLRAKDSLAKFFQSKTYIDHR